MSHNLVPFVLEDVHMTPSDVISHLSDQVPGRNIGDRFVITARVDENNDLEFELDDGSKYVFQCRKVN